MEPSKEAISVRLARMNNQIFDKSVISIGSGNVLRRLLNTEGLLDALVVLYDECNNEVMKKSDEHVAKFVDKYRVILSEIKRLRVNISDFEVKDVIGRGYFGEVHVVREKHTGDVFAMKTLRKETTLKHKDNTFYEEEKDIMALSKSEWLIKLHFAFQDSAQLYLVMDYCPGGDLAGLLDRRGQPLTENEACFYAAELCQALNALHTMGYVHRDVKPDNVLLDRCGHLKLADFGSAAKISSKGRATAVMPVGTPDYIAPELLKSMELTNSESHGPPCDFWSLGVVAYELVTLKTPYSDQSDRVVNTFGNIMRSGKITYPSDVEKTISTEYKELIRCLLNPSPELRYGYLDVLRHPALKNVHWITLRNEVPPFVPLVSALDDTSNFVEFEKQLPKPSLENFLNRNQFSGRNLPFIGFTYTEAGEPLSQRSSCCDSGAGGDSFATTEDLNSSIGSHDRSIVNGFMNSSYNSTAINMKSVRELERALETRSREAVSLKKMLSDAENRARLMTERTEKMSSLEHDLAHSLAAVSRLTRQIDLEHKDRLDLETKSLELISLAKKKWEAKSLAQKEAMNKTIVEYEFKNKELECEKEMLGSKIKTLALDLEKARNEISSMKALQINYKESMAKARLVSRQSTATNDCSNAVRVTAAAREMAAADDRARRLAKELRSADDRHKSLLVELNEFKKDYADLLKERSEVSDVHDKVKLLEDEHAKLLEEFENQEKKLNARIATLGQNVLNEKSESAKLRSQIRKLQSELNDTKRSLDIRKSDENDKAERSALTVARLEETLRSSEKKNAMVQKKLDETLNSEERHKDKVTDLENLIQKLEQDVSRLEGCASSLSSNTDVANAAKVSLLEDQLSKMEEQLSRSREKSILVKEESKRNATALWKKEKELSDCDLDRRIAQRELKQMEAKVKTLTEQLQGAMDEKAKHEDLLESKERMMDALKKEIDSSIDSLEKAEETVKNMQNKCEKKEDALAKAIDDMVRLRNDVQYLKTELQHNESRRTKAEMCVDELRLQLKNAEELKSSGREDNIKLNLNLEEKTRDLDTLNANHKILQDTCSLLEDQLMDFEKLSESQEKQIDELKMELSTMRAAAEASMLRISGTEKNAAQLKAERDSLRVKMQRAKADIDHHSHRADQLEKELSIMQAAASEAESRVMNLEENSTSMMAENMARMKALCDELRSVKEECASAATNLYSSRDHAAKLAETVRHLQDEVLASRRAAAAAEAEASARSEHYRQRELRAQATITQHTKLIDFLQAKVEESTRRKRSGLGNLFRSGRDTPIPGSPTPAVNTSNTERSLHRERQKNRELREQLSLLKHKLAALEGVIGTDGNSLSAYDSTGESDKSPVQENRAKINGVDTLAGWVRIMKGESTERTYMSLSDGWLRWHSDLPTVASSRSIGEVQLKARSNGTVENGKSGHCSVRLHTKLTSENVPGLSETERTFAFMLECPGLVTCWPSRQILVVCPSDAIRERWLKALSAYSTVETEIARNQNGAQNILYAPRTFLNVQRTKVQPRCIIEIKKNVYLVGAEQGLFSYHTPSSETLDDNKSAFNGPDETVRILGLDNIINMKAVEQANMLLSLCGAVGGTNGAGLHLSASGGTLWWCDLRSTASVADRTAAMRPTVKPRKVSLPNDELCRRFDVMVDTECIVCAYVTGAVVILVKDTSHEGSGLLPRRRVETVASITASSLSARSLLVAAGPSVYHLDLLKYQVDAFLEPELTRQFGERNIIDIIYIKKQRAEHNAEYLICYKECGIFVDQCGRRSRMEDLKWSGLPTQITFRQPFLYVFYYNSVHVLGIDERVCQLPVCECNCDSSSVSTISVTQDKVVIDIQSPKYMGSSIAGVGILVSSSKGQNVSVVEIDGAECFRRALAISMEALDTADDEANEGWNDEIDGAIEVDAGSETSSDCTDFSLTIRKRAMMLQSKRTQEPEGKSDSDSSTSGSANKTSAEICAEIFAADRKQVRFGTGFS